MDTSNHKLRILHLIHDLKKGGAERFVVDICGELCKRHDVDVKVAILKNDNAYQFATGDLSVVCLDNFYNLSVLRPSHYDAQNYCRLLDTFKPHVVHTHLLRAELFSTLVLRDDIAYVTHGHDNMVQFAPLSWRTALSKSRITNYFEKRIIYKTKYARTRTHFVVNSEDTKRYYERVLPLTMVRDVHLIQLGFNYQRFYNDHSKSMEDGSRQLRLINIGSYHEPKKNQGFLIAIAKELQKLNIDFIINQMGEGPLRRSVQQEIDKAGLSNKIILHGNVDDIEQRLWDSDIYVHTAWYEPFGLVFLEAMAAGLPVVALDGRGNRGLIRDGFNGYFITEQNPAIFAKRIQTLMKDSALYSTTSYNGREFAREFSIERKADEFVALYKSLVESKSTGSA